MRKLLSTILSSIAFKLGLVVVAMGLMTATAVAIGLLVFHALTGSLNTLVEEQLPGIENSVAVILDAGALREAMSASHLGEDPDALKRSNAKFETLSARLKASVDRLPRRAAEEIIPQLDILFAANTAMLEAMAEKFVSNRQMREQLSRLSGLSSDLRDHLRAASDAAHTSLTRGSANTITTVSETLANLIDRDFATMTKVLEAQAEINLLAGVALVKSGGIHPDISPILDELSTNSRGRLDAALDVLSGVDIMAAYMPGLIATRDGLSGLTGDDFLARRTPMSETLTLRQTGATVIGAALDDLSFSLAVSAEEAVESNSAAITGMIDTQIRQIRSASELDVAVMTFIATALRAAAVASENELAAIQSELDAQSERLERLVAPTNLSPDIRQIIRELSELGDPEAGVAASRKRMLGANAAAIRESHNAEMELKIIADAARNLGTTAIKNADAAAVGILAQTALAESRMAQVAIACFVLVLATPLLAWLFILRPLGSLTRLTERLARGDLSEISGLRDRGGEIGRMTHALAVFRQGLIERRDMQEQEALAEAERHELARAQEFVVGRLAESLDLLSSGNLGVVIEQSFSSGYEDLRLDFNKAISQLSESIGQLARSAGQVQKSAIEINDAASHLAVRTEENARTLAETSHALSELNATSAEAAERTKEARTTMTEAHRKTVSGASVAEAAMHSMTEVEQASTEISKIVGLIEDIAFQTNLLALNAGVEAARSGEHGRGFAVVATEVRSLAQRATEAASEINQLIRSTRDQISTGVVQVRQTGHFLTEISDMVGQMNDFINTITAASQEQSSRVSTINDAIAHLDHSTQKNAAVFEETAAATKLLSDESTRMSALASRFSVGEDHAKNERHRDIGRSPGPPRESVA